MVVVQLFAPGRFHIMKLCSRLYSTEVEVYFLKTKNRFLSHPLGDLGATFVGKLVVDFLFVIIYLFFSISYG